jgi:hypothetical protein
MTDEERSSPDNGIWLCATRATEIDKDPQRFPVALLRQWKEAAEDEALKTLEDPTYRNFQQQRDQLAAFLTEAQALRARLGEMPLPVAEHNAWVDRVSKYLRESLSSAHEIRFSDSSGMTFYGEGSEQSKMSHSLEGRSRRLHEFLSEMGV